MPARTRFEPTIRNGKPSRRKIFREYLATFAVSLATGELQPTWPVVSGLSEGWVALDIPIRLSKAPYIDSIGQYPTGSVAW
jgi:hypothetical protein